ncbi:MAG: FecR family protein [Nitrospira sp.]|nr:FecR family protein [Nitrospira sp.]
MVRFSDEQRRVTPNDREAGIRHEAIAWVVRLHNSRIQPEDQRTFEAWRAQSADHARMFDALSGVWNDPEWQAAAVRSAERSPLQRGHGLSGAVRRWPRVVAGIAVCVAVLAIAVFHADLMVRFQSDYRTGTGERQTIQLPDRSTVTLNTQSAIATTFDGTVRRVRLLKGEAFFQVQPDPDHPFIVESREADTRAVGTEFVVRAQPGFDQVTVLEGLVEVRSRGGSRSTAQVPAGAQLQCEQGQLSAPHPVDSDSVSAWLRGRLVVDGVLLAQVIDEVRRYYPGTIVLWDQDLGEIRVTGTYNVDDPAGVLSLLVKTFPLQMVSLTDRLAILF